MARSLNFICAASLGLWTGFSAVAQVTNPPAKAAVNFVSLQVEMRDEAIIAGSQTHRVYVTANTNRIAFVLPPTCRLDGSNPSRVVITETENNCFLTLRVIAPPKHDPDSPPPPSFQEILLGDHPGAVISSEFSKDGGGHNGPAFDLQTPNSGFVRTTFLPFHCGTLEISLQSQSGKVAEIEFLFDRLLWSLCSDENGPIKPMKTPTEPPLS